MWRAKDYPEIIHDKIKWQTILPQQKLSADTDLQKKYYTFKNISRSS